MADPKNPFDGFEEVGQPQAASDPFEGFDPLEPLPAGQQEPQTVVNQPPQPAQPLQPKAIYGFGQQAPSPEQNAAKMQQMVAASQQANQAATRDVIEFAKGVPEGVRQFGQTMAQGYMGMSEYLPLPQGVQDAKINALTKARQIAPMLFDPMEKAEGAREAGRIVGSFADPVINRATSAFGEKAIERILPMLENKGLLLSKSAREATEKAFQEAFNANDKAAVEAASSSLFRDQMSRSVAKGLVQDPATGAIAGAMTGIANQDSAEEIAKKAAASAAGSLVLGPAARAAHARFGSEGRLLKNAPKNVGISFKVENSPVLQELKLGLKDLAQKDEQLKAEFRAAVTPVEPSEKVKEQVAKRRSALLPQRERLTSEQIRASKGIGNKLEQDNFLLDQEIAQLDQKAQQAQAEIAQTQPFGGQAKPKTLGQAEQLSQQRQQLESKKYLINLPEEDQQKLLKSGALSEDQKILLNQELKYRADTRARSAKLAQDYQKLDDVEAGLQEKLKPKAPKSQEEITKIAQKRQDVLKQLSLVEDEINQFPTSGVRAQKGSNQFDYLVEQGVNKSMQQYEKVMKSPAFQNLPVDKRAALAEAEFQNMLRTQGISPQGDYIPFGAGDKANQAERFSKIGQVTGTRTGEVVLDTHFAGNAFFNERSNARKNLLTLTNELEKRGWDRHRITNALQYFEDGGFNPNEVMSPSLSRPVWSGALPNPEDQQLFMGLRTGFNQLFDEAVGSGALSAERRVQGYVPLMKKMTSSPGSRSAQGIADPTFAEVRQEGYLDPTQYETDITQLVDRYTSSVYGAKHLRPVLQNASKELFKLELMGYRKAADAFKKTVSKSLNLKEEAHWDQIFKEDFMARNRPAIEDALMAEGVPQSAATEFFQELDKMAYQSLVAINPKNIALQVLQPEFTLPQEVGARAYAMARGQASKARLSEMPKYNELLKHSLRETMPALEELSSAPVRSLPAKALKGVSTGVRKLGLTRPFEEGEILNRITAYKAAENAFNNAFQKGGVVGLTDLTKTLTTAEQAYVLRALKEQGEEASKKAYSLVIDKRANFAYGLADSPEILREGLGKYVRFATYARNLVARFQGDIQRGNVGQAAKRAIGPLVVADLLSTLSGKDFSEAVNPVAQVEGLVKNPPIAPVAMTVAKEGFRLAKDPSEENLETAGKNLMKLTPMGRANTLVERYEEGEPLGGFKERDDDTWVEKLFRR